MTPAPLPRPPADPGSPRVWLDVRLGPGPVRAAPLSAGQFLVGGADGCDLHLPDAGLPPVVCVFATSADGTTVRRHDRGYPVSVNGKPLPDLTPVRLSVGDRVTVGPAELTFATVSGDGYLRPRFVALLDQPQAAQPPRPAAPLSELDALRQRVQVLEAERDQWDRQQSELATTRDELDALHRSLSHQYSDRRDQLVRMQEAVREAAAALQEREQRFEAETARRSAELAAREQAIEALTAELAARPPIPTCSAASKNCRTPRPGWPSRGRSWPTASSGSTANRPPSPTGSGRSSGRRPRRTNGSSNSGGPASNWRSRSGWPRRTRTGSPPNPPGWSS